MNQTLDPLSTALGVGTDTGRRSPGGSRSPDTRPACVPGAALPHAGSAQCLQALGKLGGPGTGTHEGLLWPDLPGCLNFYKNFMGVACTPFQVMVREVIHVARVTEQLSVQQGFDPKHHRLPGPCLSLYIFTFFLKTNFGHTMQHVGS